MPLIHVNGREYQLVSVDDLTLDEAVVFQESSKLSLDQIPELEGFHAGLIRGLILVSVIRGEPDEPEASIKRAVGKLRVSELDKVFTEISVEVDDENPTTANGPSSPPAATGGTSAPTGEPSPAASPGNGSGNPGSDTGVRSDLVTWGE